jgi:hypothetical protein
MKTILVLALMMVSPYARANSVESLTSAGTGTFSEGLTYNGESKSNKDAEDGRAGFNWTIGYAYTAATLGATSTAPTPAPTTNASSDHTNSISLGGGYSDKWEIGLGIDYSNTKEENLKSFGPNAYLGYTFDLANRPKKLKRQPQNPNSPTAKVDSDVEDDASGVFVPTLNFRITGASNKFTHDASLTTRAGSRKQLAATATQEITQKDFEIDGTLSALEWLDVKLSYIKYNYDKNVADFLARLDQARAVQTGLADFGSTLSGFSSKEWGINLTFHLPLDLDFGADFTQSTSAIDGTTKTNTFKGDLSRVWAETWKTGLGFERSKSNTDVQNIGLLTLAYEF